MGSERERDLGDERVDEQRAQHDGDALRETAEVAVDDGGVRVQRSSEGAVGADGGVFPLHEVLVLIGRHDDWTHTVCAVRALAVDGAGRVEESVARVGREDLHEETVVGGVDDLAVARVKATWNWGGGPTGASPPSRFARQRGGRCVCWCSSRRDSLPSAF